MVRDDAARQAEVLPHVVMVLSYSALRQNHLVAWDEAYHIGQVVYANHDQVEPL